MFLKTRFARRKKEENTVENEKQMKKNVGEKSDSSGVHLATNHRFFFVVLCKALFDLCCAMKMYFLLSRSNRMILSRYEETKDA